MCQLVILAGKIPPLKRTFKRFRVRALLRLGLRARFPIHARLHLQQLGHDAAAELDVEADVRAQGQHEGFFLAARLVGDVAFVGVVGGGGGVGGG